MIVAMTRLMLPSVIIFIGDFYPRHPINVKTIRYKKISQRRSDDANQSVIIIVYLS
jgi:hypothetical protein